MNKDDIARNEQRAWWTDFLSTTRKPRTSRDWKDANTASENWDSCIVSTLKGIEVAPPPALFPGQPFDATLLEEGEAFDLHITKHDLRGARRCFNRIMKRGIELHVPNAKLETF